MNILKIFLILIAIVVVWTFGRTFLLFQKSKELVAESAPFTQEVGNPTKHILVLGDSTAVGTGTSDPQYSVAGRLGEKYPHAHIENWAENGNKIADVKQQLEEKKLEKYDLILLQVGANDIIFNTPLSKAGVQAAQVLDVLKRHTDSVAWIVSGNIGLAPFFPQPVGWYLQWRTKKFHHVFKEIAVDQEVVFVDLYKKRKNDPFSEDPKKYYASDFLHLSDAGYGVWFDELIQATGIVEE